MEAASDFAQLELRLVNQIQWRYELIRPLILFEDRPARQRAHDTHTHPETVRKLRRRFQQQGMLGLLLDDVEIVPKEKTPGVSVAVVEEMARLKALYAGFHARELVRIIFYKLGERIDHKTAQRLWYQSAVTTQEPLPLGDYHAQPDRYQARLQVIKLYAQGWEKISISRFLHVSRPTVNAWIKQFATEHFPGLLDKSSAPNPPARKVWLPLMIEVYHPQSAIPMLASPGSGVSWPTPRFRCGPSRGSWPLTRRSMTISPMYAAKAPNCHRSPTPTKPRVPTSIGSSTAA